MSLPFVFQLALGPKKAPRFRETPSVAVLHRLGFPTAADAAHAFEGGLPAAAKVVGYRRPYHFVVERDGRVVQHIPLVKRGAHAASWNARSIGVALLGDFRRQPPGGAQLRAAAQLCALLGLEVHGHTDLAGASKDPNKECPGGAFNLEDFRALRAQMDVEGARLSWAARVA